jgi:hypothetical protein
MEGERRVRRQCERSVFAVNLPFSRLTVEGAGWRSNILRAVERFRPHAGAKGEHYELGTRGQHRLNAVSSSTRMTV